MTDIKGDQIRDGEVGRAELDILTSGQAVIRKIIAGANVTIGWTGVDEGTGDVTINATGGGAVVPTFTITDRKNFVETFRLNPFKMFESLNRSDILFRLNPFRLNETVNRGDVYKLPTMSIKPPDSIRKTDTFNLTSLRLSDSIKKTDLSTMVITITTPGSFNFPVPAGVTTMKLECWGAGGGGGISVVSGAGAGGGGSYARTDSFNVSGASNLLVFIAGVSSPQTSGSSTSISRTGSVPTTTSEGVLANGGAAGQNGSAGGQGTGGPGGDTTTSLGVNSKLSGGNGGGGGGIGTLNGAGGGGGSGDANAGNNGTSAGAGGTGGTAGGGIGGAGAVGATPATNGSAYGGGGGGASTLGAAASGAQGQVRITYSI